MGDLHDEHDNIAEHDAAEGDEEPVAVLGRGGLQANVFVTEEHQLAVSDADQELDWGDEPVFHSLRMGGDGWSQPELTYTKSLEPPAYSNFFLKY